MIRQRKMSPRPHAKPPRFDPAAIADRVRAARKKKRMAAKTLAAAVGVGKDALLKKEKNVNPFYLDELSKIAEELGAPSLWPLLDWDVAMLVDDILHRG